MAVIKGNSVTLYIKAEPSNLSSDITSLTSYARVKGVTSASISASNATYEVNYKDTTGATGAAAPELVATRGYAVGTTTVNLSVEGVYDPSLTNEGAEDVFDLCKEKTRIGVFWAGNAGQAVGGVGFCTSFDLSAGMDDFVTFSAQFELSGDPTIFSV
jgi:hypothetical protein